MNNEIPKPADVFNESEYLSKLESGIHSPEIEGLSNLGRTFKENFLTACKDVSTDEEAVQKLGAMTKELATKMEPEQLDTLVNNPYLFQSLFIRLVEDGKGVEFPRKPGVKVLDSVKSTDEIMNAAFFDAAALAYLTQKLDDEGCQEFINKTVSEDGRGTYGDIVFDDTPIFSKKFLANQENRKSLESQAKFFCDAIQLGKTMKANYYASENEKVKELFPEFYHMIGNATMMFLLKKLAYGDEWEREGVFRPEKFMLREMARQEKDKGKVGKWTKKLSEYMEQQK